MKKRKRTGLDALSDLLNRILEKVFPSVAKDWTIEITRLNERRE